MISIHILGQDYEVVCLADDRLMIGHLLVVPDWETLLALLPSEDDLKASSKEPKFCNLYSRKGGES